MFTDHKNLQYVNSTDTSQRAIQRRFCLEELVPEIYYIKGLYNTAADAIVEMDAGYKISALYVTRHRQM